MLDAFHSYGHLDRMQMHFGQANGCVFDKISEQLPTTWSLLDLASFAMPEFLKIQNSISLWLISLTSTSTSNDNQVAAIKHQQRQ